MQVLSVILEAAVLLLGIIVFFILSAKRQIIKLDDGVLRQRASQPSVEPKQLVLLGRARRCVPPTDGFN